MIKQLDLKIVILLPFFFSENLFVSNRGPNVNNSLNTTHIVRSYALLATEDETTYDMLNVGVN